MGEEGVGVRGEDGEFIWRMGMEWGVASLLPAL